MSRFRSVQTAPAEKLRSVFDLESSGRVILYSDLVGVVAGLGAAGFFYVLNLFQEFALGHVEGYFPPAIFRAPLGGALFAVEVLYASTAVEFSAIVPCVVASVGSYSVFASIFGPGLASTVPESVTFGGPTELPSYLVFAVVCAVTEFLYVWCFYGMRDHLFRRIPIRVLQETARGEYKHFIESGIPREAITSDLASQMLAVWREAVPSQLQRLDLLFQLRWNDEIQKYRSRVACTGVLRRLLSYVVVPLAGRWRMFLVTSPISRYQAIRLIFSCVVMCWNTSRTIGRGRKSYIES